MHKTGTLVLLLVLTATGLMAQPNPATDGAFDCYQYVGTASESVVAPNGQLPDGEVGIDYEGAHVVLKGGELTAPTGYYVINYFVSGLPLDMIRTNDYRIVSGIAVCYQARFRWFPTLVGTYPGITTCVGYKKLAGYPTAWPDVWYGPVQYYDLEIRPTGYGVVYPPLLGGGGSGSSKGDGGGGDDSSCSTVAGAGLGVPTTLSAILGALFWRRRREE